MLLLGGEPFAEEIVMWWNFIGRTHEEVAAFREQWEQRAESRHRAVPARDHARRAGDGGTGDADRAAQAATPPTTRATVPDERGRPVNPVDALREIGFLLERGRSDTHRVKAYRRAADIVAALDPDERARHAEADDWKKIGGIGPKTALVISQASAGRVPDYLQQLRDEKVPLATGGDRLRAAIKGDLHVHSTWSDGGSPLEEMMITARSLGHEYCAITDHSPRLTVARGLTAERLRQQLADHPGPRCGDGPFPCPARDRGRHPGRRRS